MGKRWGKKTKNLTVTLSEDGWRLVKERAKKLGVSFSEIVERWARGYEVDSEDSVPLPKEMTAAELHEALQQKMEENEEERVLLYEFIDNLAAGKVTQADVAELAGLMEMDEAKAKSLMQIVIQNKKGGKKPNGV